MGNAVTVCADWSRAGRKTMLRGIVGVEGYFSLSVVLQIGIHLMINPCLFDIFYSAY